MRLLQFKEKMDLAGYALLTIEHYSIAVQIFFRYIQDEEGLASPDEICKQHITSYHATMRYIPYDQEKQKFLSTSSIRRRLKALKAYFKLLAKGDLIEKDLSKEIDLPPQRDALPKRVPSEKDMVILLTSIIPTRPVQTRDRALLELMYASGLRSSEVRSITVDALSLQEKTIFVTGKGSKDRIIPVGSWVIPYLKEYLNCRQEFSTEPSNLFFLSKGGKKITEGNLCDLLRKYTKKAGLDCHITPHSFRHACATHVLKGGADIRYVQELLGHSKLSSTQIYTKVDISFLKEAHAKFHPGGKDRDELPD